MKNINFLFLIVICIISFATSALAGNTEPNSESLKTLVSGNNAFAVEMYQKLATSDKSLFFSPYSVSSALGMTCAGAKDNTAKEMRKTLNFKLSRKLTHSTFKQLNHQLMANANNSNQKLSIANGLCLISGKVSEKFKAFIKDNYDAEVFNGDLSVLNAWVKKKTEEKIETILSQLPPNCVCVLLNAIYFKGTWDSEFEKTSTHNMPFNITSTKKVTIPMMYQRNKFKLLEKNDFKAVSLPYKGNHMSMFIVLPNKVDGLVDVEKQLTAENLTAWIDELEKLPGEKTDLAMPKFKLETKYNLVSKCKSLGIKDAFSPKTADFRNMGWPIGKLWIAQIIHKAFVEVNEEGTEAAAATAVVMQTKSMHFYPSFRADHPFIFVIKDNETGSILFMGKVVNPGAE